MYQIDQLFANMDTAEMGGSGSPKLSQGKFRVRTKTFTVMKGYYGQRFIVELEVLESTSPADPPGCSRSFTLPMDNREFNPLGAIKAIAFAMMGQDPRNVRGAAEDPAIHRAAQHLAKCACEPAYAAAAQCSPTAFAGVELIVETFPHTTRAGRTVMKHTWNHAKSCAPGSIVMSAAPSTPPPPKPPPTAPPPVAYPPQGWGAPAPAPVAPPPPQPAPYGAPAMPPAGRPTYEQWLASQGYAPGAQQQ